MENNPIFRGPANPAHMGCGAFPRPGEKADRHATTAARFESRFLCLFLILCGFLLIEPAYGQADFNSRRGAFLNYYDTTVPNLTETGSGQYRIGRTGFFFADGRYLTNDLANGSNFMSAALGDADSEAGDAGFSTWPAMDCYLRWTNLAMIFTPAINTHFQSQLTTNGIYYGAGTTPNQKMMASAARYFAGNIWGTGAFPAGSQYQATYGTGDPTGKAYLSNTIVTIPLYGMQEHDSPIYVGDTLGPIYTMEQFAPDPVLRQKARMAFDWAVAEISGYYFYDNWAIPATRTFPYWTQDSPTETAAMSYLFFGGPTLASYENSYLSAPYCMTNPGFPGILPEVSWVATNRANAYVQRCTAMGNTGGWNIGYYKTSYLTTGYSLYSQAECTVATNSDGSFSITNFGSATTANSGQMQRWGVVWNDPHNQTKFWITNPYDPVYAGSGGHYIGTTISEETVQLNGTLAAVYNIPTNATIPDWNHGGAATVNYQELEGSIPTNYLALIDNAATGGRVYLHYTNVLIALYISTNFTWFANANKTSYFQIPANIAGLAVETASPLEYTQSTAALRLAAFRNDVLTAGSVNTSFLTGPNPAMIYTDRHSNTLQITYGQGAKTNGRSIDYQQWPTIDNPWMHQSQLGNLFIFGTNRTIIYNYNNWTETTNYHPTVLAGPSPIATQNSAVSVDLTNFASDVETPASNLLFSVNNPANGSVALTDAHTAQFIPATNFLGAAVFNFTVTDTGVDPRLVLYYSFEPPDMPAGNSIADVSGNARDAAIVTVGAGAAANNGSAPAKLTPFSSQSLRLTQNSSGANAVALARVVTRGNLDMTNAGWTFATWFNRASQTNDNIIFYVGSGDGFGGTGDELQLYCPSNQSTIALAHWNGGNVQDISLASGAGVGTNEWHQVALVFDHAADGTNTVSLYLDGAPAGTVSNVVWALKQDRPLMFGGHGSTVSATDRWFDGSLDDLALFRGALSSNEVATLATRTAGHFGGWTVTNAITVNVVAPPPNTPPVLAPIADHTLNAGNTLIVTNMATDTDQPPQTLTFNLAGAPTNATIGPGDGVLNWRPAVAQADTTNRFTVTVTDSGSPSLSATQSFFAVVLPLARPFLTNAMMANHQFQFMVNGDSGPDYTIQASTNLATWDDVFTTNPSVLPFNWSDTNTGVLPQHFYRLELTP